jgi:uncharacterized protein (TIGR02996 family)
MDTSALFDAVYANPDDDAPRQVLADRLIEVGDPRGELIMLQLRGGDHLREQRLLRKHRVVWLGELASMVDPKTARFRRGFPSDVQRVFHGDKPRNLTSAAWSTIEVIDRAHDLIGTAPLRALRSIAHPMSGELLDELRDRLPPRLEDVTIVVEDRAELLARVVDALPALRRARLIFSTFTIEVLEAVLALPALGRLELVQLAAGTYTDLAAFRERARGLAGRPGHARELRLDDLVLRSVGGVYQPT